MTHLGQGGSVRLPSSYVAQHVALGYALTVHKAQGTTVDRAVVVVDGKMSAEQLYVAMSRGREHNSAVFVCEAPDTDHGRFRTPSPMEVLARVVRHDGAELSATEIMRQERTRTVDPESRAAQHERQRAAREAQARAWDRRRRSESRDRGGRGRGR